MKKSETGRFHEPYQRPLRLLKLQGKSQKTIEILPRAVPRFGEALVGIAIALRGPVQLSEPGIDIMEIDW